MKGKFLIYSIISFCIIAMTQNVECAVTDNGELMEYSIIDLSDESVCPEDFSLSAAESEFSIPRPTNFTNIPRSQTVAKRTLTRGHDTFCVLKDGKFLNKQTTTKYLYNLNRFPSGLTEATHHLISLGKLVI